MCAHDYMHSLKSAISLSASDPTGGIGLRFEPTVKEKFQVDDCGNAGELGPKVNLYLAVFLTEQP